MDFQTTSSDKLVLAGILEGLSQQRKKLPTHLLYDERGSQIFEQIMELDEYYPTRAELSILDENAAEIAQNLGEHPLLVEYGAGNSAKTRKLLDLIKNPAVYMPIDISSEFLQKSVAQIQPDYPNWEIVPVVADFLSDFKLPKARTKSDKTIVYFSGSTIGNLELEQARELLKKMARECKQNGHILIGVDLIKDRQLLLHAYNDKKGLTSDFNLNILTHINRDFGGNFEVSNFKHSATFDEDNSRIVMNLVSTADQTINIGGRTFQVEDGEKIITEYSHKYSADGFKKLASQANLTRSKLWLDRNKWFSLQLLAPS